MACMRGVFSALLLAWSLIAAAPLFAQEEEEEFIAPPPPADGILDEARILSRDTDRHRAIAEAISQLQEKYKFHLYYALYDSLIGSNAGTQAVRLQKAWLGDQPGIVIVLETDSGIFRFGQVAPKQQEIEPGKNLELAEPLTFSSFELTELVRSMEDSLKSAADRSDYAEKLGIGTAQGISTLLEQREAAPGGDTHVRMVVLAIGLLAATGLLALLVVAGLKRAEAKSQERYVFPKVNVGMRLGAPFGGGKVSSRSFGERRE
jgi:hypothetical protein